MEPIKDFDTKWPEYVVGILAIIGLFLGIGMRNEFFSYISITLLGFLGGRIIYIKKGRTKHHPFVTGVILLLFLYILSNFGANRLLLLTLAIVSVFISYTLHKKKIFTIFKSKNFLK